MPILSRGHFPVSLGFFALLIVLLSVDLSRVNAQFPGGGMPSAPSPGRSFGGGRPSAPRPGGYNSRRPSTPRPNSYRTPTPNYGRSPNSSNNYGGVNRGGAARNYGTPSASNFGRTPSPSYGAFRNPLAGRTPSNIHMPGRVNSYGRTTFDPTRIKSHSFSSITSGSNPFGNLKQGVGHSAARSQIDKVLQKNRNLNSLLHATSTATAVGLPRSQIQSYRNDAMKMARQQIQGGASIATPYVALAKFSLEDNKMDQFRQHTQELVNRFPDDKHSRFFNGVNLLDKKDWKAAERELKAAREAGIPEKDIAGFLKMAIDNQKWIWEYAFVIGCIIGAWLLGMILLYMVGLYLSKSTVRMIQSDPNIDVSKQRARNRLYRLVSSVAGIYYFISLPVVVMLAIALPLALIYGALSLPFISLPVMGLVLVGGVGGIMTAISGVKASFVRIPPPEIERKVSKEEAPDLWALSTDVAKEVGTRPIDEIWLFGSTDLAVTEQGSFLERVRDKAKRVLVLGTGAIDRMDQGSFRAVLAHEYGHFQNRDTAGGDVSMRVNGAMNQFVQTLIEKEKIRWWDVAVRFLKTYYVMFNRITFGARRLQEVMADRVAVQAYGAPAFKRGLKHVIGRSLESQFELSQKLDDAMHGKDPNPIFEDRFTPFEREQISEVYNEIMESNSSEFDAHPSPKERFSMTSRLNQQGTDVDGDKSVWSLFKSSVDVKNEMATKSNKLIAEESKYRKQVINQQVGIISNLYRQHKDPSLLLERAQLKAGTGDFKAAVEDLSKATKIGGEHLELTLLRAIWQKHAGDIDGSLKTLQLAEKSLKNTPKEQQTKDLMYELNLVMGQLLQIKGMKNEALGYIKTAAKFKPEKSYAMEFYIGKAELDAGHDENALTRFKQAVACNGNIPEPYYYTGLIQAKHGRHEKAHAMFRKAAKLDSHDQRFIKAMRSAKTQAGQEKLPE